MNFACTAINTSATSNLYLFVCGMIIIITDLPPHRDMVEETVTNVNKL